MSTSTNSFTRRRYQQIPLYLQDVLATVSDTSGSGFTTDPDNFNALINAALELEDVLFLTLNYDTLLDCRPFIPLLATGVFDVLRRGSSALGACETARLRQLGTPRVCVRVSEVVESAGSP